MYGPPTKLYHKLSNQPDDQTDGHLVYENFKVFCSDIIGIKITVNCFSEKCNSTNSREVFEDTIGLRTQVINKL